MIMHRHHVFSMYDCTDCCMHFWQWAKAFFTLCGMWSLAVTCVHDGRSWLRSAYDTWSSCNYARSTPHGMTYTSSVHCWCAFVIRLNSKFYVAVKHVHDAHATMHAACVPSLTVFVVKHRIASWSLQLYIVTTTLCLAVQDYDNQQQALKFLE